MTVPDSRPVSQASFPDLIPGVLSFGSVNLLAGASGVGKTCLTAYLLTQIRAGLPVFGHVVTPPTAVGYVCADRGWASARYWLTKAGTQDIPFYSLADDASFGPSRLRNKGALVQILGECIDKLALPPGAFVVVDPLALFMGGNLNDYQSCAIALIEIRRLCAARNIPLLGLAHASKQKADKREQYKRLQDRILGSAAQHGYGDTQLYLASPEETGEKFYTFLWHPHTSPAEVFPLGRDPHGMFLPWDQAPEVLEEDTLLEHIPSTEEGLSFGELVLVSNLSRATVHRRLQSLLQEGRIDRVGHGCYRRKPTN